VTGLTSDQIGYDRVLEKISLILSNVTDKNLLSKVLAIHPDYDVTRFLLQVNFGQLIIIYLDLSSCFSSHDNFNLLVLVSNLILTAQLSKF
jgi:hypothetical protein